MILNLQTKQKVRITRVEQANAWLIVAVLVEMRGNETISVSEPKVIKIIPKKQNLALGGHTQNVHLALAAGFSILPEKIKSSIATPYFPVFGFKNSMLITWLGARPPTV